MLITSTRLYLRELTLNDAEFIYQLVNQASFIEHIGDKAVHSLADAKAHLQQKYIDQYHEHGFGLYGVIEKASDQLIGVCGLVSRPEFELPDIGYSLLDEFSGYGYITEAGKEVLKYAKETLNLEQVYAITSPTNSASKRVLEKLGFIFESEFIMPGYDGVTQRFIRTHSA